MDWVSGSPKVTIEINADIVSFMGSKQDYLLIFMGAWAKYSIETKDYDDKVAGNLAGIKAVIKFYQNNKANLPKEKHIEKYEKLLIDKMFYEKGKN